VRCVLCAVCCALCAVCCALCAVRCALCTVYCVLCAVCCVLCACVLRAHAVTKFLSHNMDEVSVRMAELKLKVLTRHKHVRAATLHDHLTVALTSCATSSKLLPPFVVYPGESPAAFPTRHLADQQAGKVWLTYQKAGWMDTTSFERYILFFGEHLQETYGRQAGVHILFVDNHSSRFSRKAIMTAWCKYGILIISGPAMLTHIWQPNDKLINRKFKELCRYILRGIIACDVTVTFEMLVDAVIQICSIEFAIEFAESIEKSWLAAGLIPFDQTRIEALIEREAEEDRTVARIVEMALKCIKERLEKENLLVALAKSDSEDAKKRSKLTVDVKHGQFLSSTDVLVALELGGAVTLMNKMKKEELHKYLKDTLKFAPDDFANEEGKTANMKELRRKAVRKIEGLFEEIEARTKAEIEAKMVIPRDNMGELLQMPVNRSGPPPEPTIELVYAGQGPESQNSLYPRNLLCATRQFGDSPQ